ncbi:MAG: Peptidase [Gemmatimonadetes bacterium]|nr:Peptidase [Gemmatimonadota bacterium]
MTHHSRTIGIDTTTPRLARVAYVTAAVATALLVLAASADGQRRGREQRPEALRGSRASVEKMYGFAQRHRYPFYLTPTNVDAAVAKGRLVPLTGDSTYELTRGIGFSYATNEARQFIAAFAPQYLYACGTPLTVTSAARPMSRQPRNANPHSVHPTGIAVDLRRPPPGPCLTWVRNALAELERRGIIEATEERHPVHLHLAVLAAPGSRVALPSLTQGMVAAARVPAVTTPPVGVTSVANGDVSLPPRASRTYVVRQGDTLYDIAMKMGVSVASLAEANGRNDRKLLKPGTTLVVPERGAK